MLLLEVQNECGFAQIFTCSHRERGRNAPVCFTKVSGAKVEKNFSTAQALDVLPSSVATDCVLSRGGLHDWGWSFLSSKMIFDSFESFLNLKNISRVSFLCSTLPNVFVSEHSYNSSRTGRKKRKGPPNILLNQNDRSALKFSQAGTAKQ